mgnify:CR=1 FL=1
MSDRTNQSPTDESALIQAGYRYAYSLTHDRHDAEDLIQQAALQVFKSKDRLSDKRYLFVAIRNLYIDRWRSQRRSATHRLVDEVEIPDSAANHVDVVHDRIDIEQMLRHLRFEERELLYLNCVEGYSAAQISEITGKPRGTILSQLARAKQKLREQDEREKEMQNAD